MVEKLIEALASANTGFPILFAIGIICAATVIVAGKVLDALVIILRGYEPSDPCTCDTEPAKVEPAPLDFEEDT